jgi:hypothetical protein
MSIASMAFATHGAGYLPPSEVSELTDAMLFHAEQSGNDEYLAKIKPLYHQIKASTTPDMKDSLHELEKAIEAYGQTSGIDGEDEARARMISTQAFLAPSTRLRNKLIEDAAVGYEQAGAVDKADFMREVARPIPTKIEECTQHLRGALVSLRELEAKLIAVGQPAPGPYAIMYHLSFLRERIDDLIVILGRLGETRQRLKDLAIKENALFAGRKHKPGKPLPKVLQKVINDKHKLKYTQLMRLDIESMYIFGNIGLDQFAIAASYIAGVQDPNACTFHKLVESLWVTEYSGPLTALWTSSERDLVWLYFQLGFYRNQFIEHMRGPLQRSSTMATFGTEFRLFVPIPPGFRSDADIKTILSRVRILAPQWLQDADLATWEAHARQFLEYAFMHIDHIPSVGDRIKLWDAWKEIGGSTII